MRRESKALCCRSSRRDALLSNMSRQLCEKEDFATFDVKGVLSAASTQLFKSFRRH